MNIIEKLFGADKDKAEVTDDSRTVKLVSEGKNVWRVVYAD